ncbi:MAG: hypothetical protein N2505_00110 [Endomicrobia bacterium]|nr:hypothetical protein [Endomicrobiia bacterium]
MISDSIIYIIEVLTFINREYIDYLAKVAFFVGLSTCLLGLILGTLEFGVPERKSQSIATFKDKFSYDKFIIFVVRVIIIFFLCSLFSDINRDGKYGDIVHLLNFFNVSNLQIEKNVRQNVQNLIEKGFFIKTNDTELKIIGYEENDKVYLAKIFTGQISLDKVSTENKIKFAFYLVNMSFFVLDMVEIYLIILFFIVAITLKLTTPIALGLSIVNKLKEKFLYNYIYYTLGLYVVLPFVYLFIKYCIYLCLYAFVQNISFRDGQFILDLSKNIIYLPSQDSVVWYFVSLSILTLVFSLLMFLSPFFSVAFLKGNIVEKMVTGITSWWGLGIGIANSLGLAIQRGKSYYNALLNQQKTIFLNALAEANFKAETSIAIEKNRNILENQILDLDLQNRLRLIQNSKKIRNLVASSNANMQSVANQYSFKLQDEQIKAEMRKFVAYATIDLFHLFSKGVYEVGLNMQVPTTNFLNALAVYNKYPQIYNNVLNAVKQQNDIPSLLISEINRVTTLSNKEIQEYTAISQTIINNLNSSDLKQFRDNFYSDSNISSILAYTHIYGSAPGHSGSLPFRNMTEQQISEIKRLNNLLENKILVQFFPKIPEIPANRLDNIYTTSEAKVNQISDNSSIFTENIFKEKTSNIHEFSNYAQYLSYLKSEYTQALREQEFLQSLETAKKEVEYDIIKRMATLTASQLSQLIYKLDFERR